MSDGRRLISRRRVVGWLGSGLLLVGCGASPPPSPPPSPPSVASAQARSWPAGPLMVFAAASLTDVFTELARQLAISQPHLALTYSFAGSAALRAQLREGARADLLATADEPTMDGARQDGVIDDEPRLFARNQLVVITTSRSDRPVLRLEDLARPTVKLVLAQENVPAGRYARQVIDQLSHSGQFGSAFTQRVLANLVSQESNVRQVVAKVQLGEADAGIVYVTDVTAATRATVHTIAIPEAFNVSARYLIAPIKGTANPDRARGFIATLRSPDGQALLTQHGFLGGDAAHD